MMEALAVSILSTGILVEAIYRALSNPKLKPALASVQSGLLQFRKASTDEERQHLLLVVGSKTLLLSTGFLAACVALGVIAFFPLWFFAWDKSGETVYLVSLTVLSVLWFFVRANLGRRWRPPKIQG